MGFGNVLGLRFKRSSIMKKSFFYYKLCKLAFCLNKLKINFMKRYIEIIFDTSGSMNSLINGEKKLAIAGH